jgi:heme-degrading monooxygenase HmoA
MMVVRSWRGYTSTSNADAYRRHLLENVRPKLEELAGFRGVYLLSRKVMGEVEYSVLTIWESMDAIRAFAGDDPSRAVVEPEAQAALLRFDTEVTHYQVLASPGLPESLS